MALDQRHEATPGRLRRFAALAQIDMRDGECAGVLIEIDVQDAGFGAVLPYLGRPIAPHETGRAEQRCNPVTVHSKELLRIVVDLLVRFWNGGCLRYRLGNRGGRWRGGFERSRFDDIGIGRCRGFRHGRRRRGAA